MVYSPGGKKGHPKSDEGEWCHAVPEPADGSADHRVVDELAAQGAQHPNHHQEHHNDPPVIREAREQRYFDADLVAAVREGHACNREHRDAYQPHPCGVGSPRRQPVARVPGRSGCLKAMWIGDKPSKRIHSPGMSTAMR